MKREFSKSQYEALVKCFRIYPNFLNLEFVGSPRAQTIRHLADLDLVEVVTAWRARDGWGIQSGTRLRFMMLTVKGLRIVREHERAMHGEVRPS